MTQSIETNPILTTVPAAADTYIVQDDSDSNTVKYVSHETLFSGVGLLASTTLTANQVKALNATPVEVLPTLLDATKAYVIDSVVAVKEAGTAYAAIDVADDITLKYTNGSGATLAAIEATGFLDQTTAQVRYTPAVSWTTNAPTVLLNVTPVGGAKVVAFMTNGEVTTGTGTVTLKVTYRIIDIS
jgi:hypothetical protein